MDLHDIREDYCKQALSQHDCDPNPIKQFEKWLNEAITAKVNEPTGVNVATVNEDGRPTSRMVLLTNKALYFLRIITAEKVVP